MLDTKDLQLQNYLNKTTTCSCGKIHSTDLKVIEISEGALDKIPGLVREYGYQKVYLISDENTYEVAGEDTYNILKKAKIDTKRFIYADKELIPDETALGKIMMVIDPEIDLIIAIGTGTINDICKFISFKLGIDYFIVATAPSMDGFASNVSAMITNHLKTTYETHVPKAIIGDITILKDAPMNMIAAGVGDILGKYVCLLDWKIAHLVQGEYHCSYIEEMIRSSVDAVVSSAKKVKDRDPGTIKSIMEGLVLSGIAMSYAGNSRPASGSEHHLSHYWEMMFLFQNRAPVLHGTKVGIGTIVAARLYEKLKKTQVDFEVAKLNVSEFNVDKWKEQMKQVYGIAAEEIILFEESVHKNSKEKVIPRIEILKQNWDEIHSLISTQLPSVEELIALLESMDAPTKPEQVGIDATMLANSIRYAKELRNRYGLLQILFDLGEVENCLLDK